MSEWEALRQECLHCHACTLADTRTNVVFGVGREDAEVMIIGEAPGANEDLQGEPFVGRVLAKWDRSSFYLVAHCSVLQSFASCSHEQM